MGIFFTVLPAKRVSVSAICSEALTEAGSAGLFDKIVVYERGL